jgi:hypothetical protein
MGRRFQGNQAAATEQIALTSGEHKTDGRRRSGSFVLGILLVTVVGGVLVLLILFISDQSLQSEPITEAVDNNLTTSPTGPTQPSVVMTQTGTLTQPVVTATEALTTTTPTIPTTSAPSPTEIVLTETPVAVMGAMQMRLERERSPTYATFTYPAHQATYVYSADFLQRIFGVYPDELFRNTYVNTSDRLNDNNRFCPDGRAIWYCIGPEQDVPNLLPVDAWTLFTGRIDTPVDTNRVKVTVGDTAYVLEGLPALNPGTPVSVIGVFQRPAWGTLQSWTDLVQVDGAPVITVYFYQTVTEEGTPEAWRPVPERDPALLERPAWVYSGNPQMLTEVLDLENTSAEFRQAVEQTDHLLIAGQWRNGVVSPRLTAIDAVYRLRNDPAVGYECYVNVTIPGAVCDN